MAKPEKVFRLGAVSASVFLTATKKDKKSFRTVPLQRRYRDGDQCKSSTSFTLIDLPAAIAVLQFALQHIAAAELDKAA